MLRAGARRLVVASSASPVARRHLHHRSAGFVGLPNVGKSALFNAVTASQAASSSNYPFCTIDPNVARVDVPDSDLHALGEALGSARVVPAQLEFVDIAGLVRGASAGQGLGNKFLSHVQQCDVLVHVLRCFDDGDVTHVEGGVDPVRDLDVIRTELMLKDLEWVDAAMTRKKGRPVGSPDPALLRVRDALEQGEPARSVADPGTLRRLTLDVGLPTLLTAKPEILVCNVAGDDVANNGNAYVDALRAAVPDVPAVVISALLEEQITQDSDPDALMQLFGVRESGLQQLARIAYQQLQLQTFYTAGPTEARAWLIPRGTTAPEAAGVIHSDMQRGFICAETMRLADALEFRSDKAARAAGRLRQEGKQYVCQDQDVFLFRFNVSKQSK